MHPDHLIARHLQGVDLNGVQLIWCETLSLRHAEYALASICSNTGFDLGDGQVQPVRNLFFNDGMIRGWHRRRRVQSAKLRPVQRRLYDCIPDEEGCDADDGAAQQGEERPAPQRPTRCYALMDYVLKHHVTSNTCLFGRNYS